MEERENTIQQPYVPQTGQMNPNMNMQGEMSMSGVYPAFMMGQMTPYNMYGMHAVPVMTNMVPLMMGYMGSPNILPPMMGFMGNPRMVPPMMGFMGNQNIVPRVMRFMNNPNILHQVIKIWCRRCRDM